jgi:hyperosmotically inducible protein
MGQKMNKLLTVFIFLSLFGLNGCTTVLVGGAGAGGYAAGTDERPLGVIADDGVITASVKTTLIKDDQIDAFDINVDTYRGIVTLHGHVKTSAQISRAIRLARTVSDVKKVISKLVVIK